MGIIKYKDKSYAGSYGGSVGSNPNLLINGDFRNPINQRGATSYTSNGWEKMPYSIDRWYLLGHDNSVSLTINENSVKLTSTTKNDGHFRQALEKELNGTYTVTVEVLSGTPNLYTNNGKTPLVVGKNTITLSGTFTWFGVSVAGYSSVEIGYIKVEQGSVATPFIPRLYAEELALCQRYYFSANLSHVHAHRIWMNERGGDFLVDVMTSVPMRTTPTFTLVKCSGMYDNTNNSSLTASELSISLRTIVNYQYAQLLISKTSGDMSSYDSGDWNVSVIQFTLDAEIYNVAIE